MSPQKPPTRSSQALAHACVAPAKQQKIVVVQIWYAFTRLRDNDSNEGNMKKPKWGESEAMKNISPKSGTDSSYGSYLAHTVKCKI